MGLVSELEISPFKRGASPKRKFRSFAFLPHSFTFFLPYDDPNLTKDILAKMENELFLPGKEK
jgi:hypothetical protein